MKNRLIIPSILAASVLSAGAATLQIDFNSDNSPPIQTQSGWLGTDATGNASGGGFTVTTSAVGAGAALDDRDRGALNGGGAEAAMWQDFIFSLDASTGTTKGLQIVITGLASNTLYPVTIWGYDKNSTGARTADWSGGGGSGTLSFNGTNAAPTNLTTHSFTSFNATSSGGGTLTITGLPASSGSNASNDVFINGLEIGNAIPEPSAGLLGLLGAALLHRRQQKPDQRADDRHDDEQLNKGEAAEACHARTPSTRGRCRSQRPPATMPMAASPSVPGSGTEAAVAMPPTCPRPEAKVLSSVPSVPNW